MIIIFGGSPEQFPEIEDAVFESVSSNLEHQHSGGACQGRCSKITCPKKLLEKFTAEEARELVKSQYSNRLPAGWGAKTKELILDVDTNALEYLKTGFNSHSDMEQESIESAQEAIAMSQDLPLVFIKGQKDSPACGFSRRCCALLVEHNIPFNTFNILDEDVPHVREDVKRYSMWPTYPQIYVRKKLLGGTEELIKFLETNPNVSQL